MTICVVEMTVAKFSKTKEERKLISTSRCFLTLVTYASAEQFNDTITQEIRKIFNIFNIFEYFFMTQTETMRKQNKNIENVETFKTVLKTMKAQFLKLKEAKRQI